MVSTAAFLAVFAFLPLSLGTYPSPSPYSHLERSIHRRDLEQNGARWLPSPESRLKRRKLLARPYLERGGGVDLPLHQVSSRAIQKRSLDNGSVIDLATAHNTYVVPILVGSPAVGYPLQFDLGSSDLLLASTLCGDNCPTSLGPTINPYYDTTKSSSTFHHINGNDTKWNVSFADGRVASGFIAQEQVSLGLSTIPGQVFGMMNATNLTLAEQKISGILGLGFPRLSVLARALFESSLNVASVGSSSQSSTRSADSSQGPSSTSSSATPSATSTSPYLSPLLESLVDTPHIPYPVFGLALTAPRNASRTTSTSSGPSSLPPRFDESIGSLTLGGVSSLFVSDNTTGSTVDDIEWHDVVPFGRYAISSTKSTAIDGTPTSTASINLQASQTVYASTGTPIGPRSSAATRKRQSSDNADQVDSPAPVPQTLSELEDEDYLYWAIQLRNVSVNGSDINLEASYAYLGLPSIALLDAGFNGISGPISQVAKIFDQIPDARQTSTGQWAVPCDTKMTLGFAFGGRYVTLQPSDWMYAEIASSTFCLAWPIGTAPSSDGIDWSLGTPFLKKVYSVFSYGINSEQAPLVGFLPLESYTSTSSAASSAAASTATTSTSLPALSSASTSADGSVTSSSVSSASLSPYGPVPTTIIPLSATVTVATEIPNAVLPTPTYSLPSYIFSVIPSRIPLAIETMGLANASAYSVGKVPIISPVDISNATTTSVGGIGVDGGLGTSSPGNSAGGADLRSGISSTTVLLVAVGILILV